MAIKSLLVGINTYPEIPLNGCINDVGRMGALLTQSYGLADDHMRVLTDSAATRAAILDGLRWLAQTDAGETSPVRLFHFSGHGTQQADRNGDEKDGYDECIVPFDYTTAGLITDDMLHEIYNSFAPDGHLLLVMDCCHAGGNQRDVFDNVIYRFLKCSPEEEERIFEAADRYTQDRNLYIRQGERELWQRGDRPILDNLSPDERELWQRDDRPTPADIEQHQAMLGQRFDEQRAGQTALKGNVVLLAACRSEQSAADATIGDTEAWSGAFTYYLTEALAAGGAQLTYSALIDQVAGAMLGAARFIQEPQLECADDWKQRSFLGSSLS